MKFAAHALLFTAFAATIAHAQTNNIPQVQHVIIVIQENRTPDNLFNQDSALATNGAHVQPSFPLNNPNSGKCLPTGRTTENYIQLQPTPLYTCWDPDHSHGKFGKSHGAWNAMWDSGGMDGACNIFMLTGDCKTAPACLNNGPNGQNGATTTCPYTYVENSTWEPATPHHILDPYFQIASQFGYANYMFATNQGPSFPAHQFLFSGTSAPVPYPDPNGYCTKTGAGCWQFFDAENVSSGHNGCLADTGVYLVDLLTESLSWFNPPQGPSFPCYDHGTLTDLLENAGISWKYYARGQGDLWTAPNAISHICLPVENGNCTGTDFTQHVVLPTYNAGNNTGDAAPILTDIESCNLQQVSWVIPDGNWSDHSNYPNLTTGGDGGPSWVAAIVNAVGNTSACPGTGGMYWGNTVVLVVWDDWGGYYDDVAPPDCPGPGECSGYSNKTGQQYVYGFRVPLLVVGAYATPGYISGGNIFPPNCAPPNTYCHDFGSILNFIEYAFGTGGNPLGNGGGISPEYNYADVLAMDTNTQHPYSLYDFFNFSQLNQFQTINGAKYQEECFHHPLGSGCFSMYPLDPDNDANDSD